MMGVKKTFDLKNMSSHLSFHKKIIGKALKFIRIRLLEHWQNSLAFCFDKSQKLIFLNEISNFPKKMFLKKFEIQLSVSSLVFKL